MAAETPWRAWEVFTSQAIDRLEQADESTSRSEADQELRAALVYAVLAVAAAIAHYPDGWGEPERQEDT